MYCSKCGKELKRKAGFCPKCGAAARKVAEYVTPSVQLTEVELQPTSPTVQPRSNLLPWIFGAGSILGIAIVAIVIIVLLLLLLFVPGNQPSTQTVPQTGGTQFPATAGQQPATNTQQPAGGAQPAVVGGTWGTQQPADSTGATQQTANLDQNLYGNWLASGEQGKRLMGFVVNIGTQQKPVCTFINYENKQFFPAYCTSQGNYLTMLDDTNTATKFWYYLANNSLFMMMPAGNSTLQVVFQRTQIDLLKEAGISISKGPADSSSTNQSKVTNLTFIVPLNWTG